VTGRFQKPLLNRINRVYGKIQNDKITNSFCLISGRTSLTNFIPPLLTIRLILFPLSFLEIVRFRVIIQFLSPLIIGSGIIYGYSIYNEGKDTFYPSTGWVKTLGQSGSKNCDGVLYGHIFWFFQYLLLNIRTIYVGVLGFTGLKIYNSYYNRYYYLGFASYVNINSEHPSW